MGKKTERSDFKVVIYPNGFMDHKKILNTEEEYMDACKAIMKKIKMHVVGISNISIQYEMEEYCEYCGYLWEKGNDTYNGLIGCCGEDQKNR